MYFIGSDDKFKLTQPHFYGTFPLVTLICIWDVFRQEIKKEYSLKFLSFYYEQVILPILT